MEKQIVLRACARCGTDFVPRNSRSKFCCRGCNIQVNKSSGRKPIEWDVDPVTGCWICTSHAISVDRPVISVYGRQTILSRFLYEELFGEIPEGLLICHKCDNPPCINPEHIYAGTPADNVRDMVDRGRNRNGAILSEDQVKEILLSPDSIKTLSERLGVGMGAVSAVRLRNNWKSVLPEIPPRGRFQKWDNSTKEMVDRLRSIATITE